ncbi:hypothetical protein BSKO_10489 [Bryopsis sp. KO-2023]|nr:hypothetical protein BSKO_10489 [Bryopsis sp. KO-2023]
MSSLAPGLARKAKKILETKTEDPELLSSLAVLSSFYEQNTPSDRRKLRSTIERKGLEVTSELLDAAESILHSLDSLQSDLDGLSTSCNRINSALATHKTGAADFLTLAQRFESELEANKKKSEVVEGFLNQYQLSTHEVRVIQEGEVGGKFFDTLKRVRTIHGNCKGLLRTEHQRAGLELMDTMAVYQETAYERLSRWVQGRCRGLADADADEIDPILKLGVQTLADRPMLYRYCVEELTTARHNALFHRFISALTRGTRPIEMHADDPNRYVNDMLAWVHQSLASEKEMVDSLFGERPAAESNAEFVSETDRMPTMQEMMDKIFESVCQQLKVRVEQVLIASPPVLLCFQLSQLLNFYLETIMGMVGGEFSLVGVLHGCHVMASRTFHEQLRTKGEKLLRNPPVVGQDFLPPREISEAMALLLEILEAHESAIETSSKGTNNLDVSEVITAVIHPLIEACNQSSEALALDAPTRLDENTNTLDPSGRETFLINCLDAIRSPLEQRQSSQSRAQAIAAGIDGHVESLINSEVARLLGKCGMGEVAARVKEYVKHQNTGAVMASDQALNLDRISEAMRGFFAVVSEPDAIPEFHSIQNARYRGDAVRGVGLALVEMYEMVYEAVGNPDNGYDALGGTERIRHTPQQVKTVLCV